MPIDSRDRVATRSGTPSTAHRSRTAGSARAGGPGNGNRPRAAVPPARRRWSIVVAIGLLVAVLAGAGAYVGTRLMAGGSTCSATVDGVTYHVDPEQAANARTITAVASQLGLPHHAVTIALAAAFQESKLHNVSGGDRDSVGLFQQRPSQGWGRPAQLMTPSYAAAAFYRALARVDGWETMSVTEAAQHVQRSAAPDAYAAWEPDARALARILTGEIPNQLVCHT